jgi:hypothetical protein
MKRVATSLWSSACLSATLSLSTAAHAQAENSPAPHEDGPAVQRFELRPLGGWAILPNSLTGPFVGADAAFRFSRFFAAGGDFAWYAPFALSEGAHPSYPLNELRWSWNVDAYLVPFPARAQAGAAAGAIEGYALGGFGLLASRPVPVIDPVHRTFSDNNLVDFDFGVGARVFVGEREAITLEVRDLLYFEKTENAQVSNTPTDPRTFYGNTSNFTNAIELRLGASLFLFGG